MSTSLMLKKILSITAFFILFFSVTVGADTAVKTVPLGEFTINEMNGKTVVMSKNGRYYFKDGVLQDNWSGTPITNIPEAKKSSETIPIKKMMKDIKKLNIISFGKGNKSFFVFVDPQCKFCKAFVKSAQAYSAEYTFNLVVVPALGPSSNKLAKSLFCAADKSNALNDFLDEKLGSLKQLNNCDTSGYDQTLLLAQIMNIKGVPFFVSEIGFFHQGADDSIWSWMKKTPTI